MRKRLWIPLGLMVLSIILTFGFHGRSYDDAFITFRCARHLAEGHGMRYNIGEDTAATTTPLLTILLAGLGRITSSDWIPAWGGVLSGFSIFLLAFLIWLHASKEKQTRMGLIAIAWIFANPFLETVWGGETLLTLALCMAAFYAYFEQRKVTASVICFAAFLARGEGLIPLGVMLAHSLWKEKRIAWEMLVTFAFLMGGWFLVAPKLGTSFLPNTLAVKMAQMQSGAFGPFVKTTLDWYRAYLIGSPTFPGIIPQPILVVFPLLAVAGGMTWLIRPSERWGWILLWPALYVAGYSALSVPFYSWYAFPIFLATAILAGIGHHAVTEWLQNTVRIPVFLRPGARVSYWTLLILALGIGARSVIQYARAPVPIQQRFYTHAGHWLKANTQPTESVGFFEIGFVGYYSERRMVCPVGLTDPESVPHVAKADFTWAYRNKQPDYILLTQVRWSERFESLRNDPDFNARYIQVAQIEEPDYFDAPIMIFGKRRL